MKIAETGKGRFLITAADDALFRGKIDGGQKICPLDHANAEALRKAFPFTAPVPVLKNKKTIGLGDRLGLATPGHIGVLKGYPDYKPVLAQQSMRELKLTGRTYENVLDDVTFAVFQEGYTGGFGADGDHLKTAADIKYALDCGYTMITLDCSDYIDNTIINLSDAEVESKYQGDKELEKKYIGKAFKVEGESLTFDEKSFKRIMLTYKKAIDFAIEIYFSLFAGGKSKADFELSIDETLTPTTPLQHFFVANELVAAGVRPATVAPRFCGEFQKGIDYIGDIAQFQKEFAVHAKIARYFGYKISVHSGSDKFAVFGIIGKETNGVFHVKTAGTNWLEAVRVIAAKAPVLYRRMHKYALSVLSEAKKYYHIGAKVENITDIDTLIDKQLPLYLDKNDSRQVLHITYGLLLDKMRGEIYAVLNEYGDEYRNNIEFHIGKHLKELNKR